MSRHDNPSDAHPNGLGSAPAQMAASGDDSGPPPTPAARARRRRWRVALGVLAVVVLVVAAVPTMTWVFTQAMGALIAATGDTDESPSEAPDEADAATGEVAPGGSTDLDDGTRPDPQVDEQDRLDVPSMAEVSGADARLLAVLIDIDVSERVMLAFQRDVTAIFSAQNDASAMLREVSEAAEAAIQDLLLMRRLLTAAADSDGTADVAGTYVEHLDTWVDYLEAIADRPELLGGDMTRYTLPINVTGGRFSRAVANRLDDANLDPRVEAFATAIVDRGFPPPDQAQAGGSDLTLRSEAPI